MDGLVEKVLVKIVIYMLMTESSGRPSSTHVAPVVVMVRDVEVAKVEVAESSVIAYKRGFPVVVEVIP